VSQASPDRLWTMIHTFAVALMSADADAVSGVGYGQRSTARHSAEDGAGWLGSLRDLVCPGSPWSPPTRTAAWSRRSLPLCPATVANGAAPTTRPNPGLACVRALLHSVCDQPDANAVHAQFDQILDAGRQATSRPRQ
jgi:hypothetical protein